MSIMLTILALLFLVFFAVYKKDMLIQMFSLNMAGPANELKEQLEVIADSAVKRMEEQMTQLELLLEEAESKTIAIDKHIQLAEKIMLQQQHDFQQLVVFRQQLVSFQEEVVANLRQQKEECKPVPLIQVQSPAAQIQPAKEELPAAENEMPAADAQREEISEVLPDEFVGDKKGLVMAMVEQGYEVADISKSTGIGQGEIQLLLQLHKK